MDYCGGGIDFLYIQISCLHEKRLTKANGEDKKSELIQNDQEKNGSWSHLNIQGCHL
jgi:hypothetical protein